MTLFSKQKGEGQYIPQHPRLCLVS